MRNRVKKSILLAMAILLTLTFSIPVYAATTANTTSGSILLDDKAGLLDQSEAAQVLEALEVASSDSNCNLVVLTTNQGLNESAIHSYADTYYATNVENKTQTNMCVTLTVDMTSRLVDVGTYNPGSKRNLNDAAKDEVREYVTSDLSSGNYVKAFTKFAEKAGKIAAGIDEDGGRNKSTFPWGFRIIISLVIGVIVALIVCSIIKKQLKTVEMKAGAADYVRPGSLNIKEQSDRFLYSNVTKTAKPKSDSSSGGGGSSGSHSTGSF